MLILEVIWAPKSMIFGVDFGCVFGMVFFVVLEWFWLCFGRLFGAKTMSKRQREDLWKWLFYVSDFAVFVVYGVHLGCQNERKTEWDYDLDSNLVLW